MKKILCILLLVSLLLSEEVLSTGVGILLPFTNTNDSVLALRAMLETEQAFEQQGMYSAYNQHTMEQTYSVIDKNFRNFCHEPHCVALIGESFNLEKMVYGDVVVQDNSYGVSLTLVDVLSAEIVDTVSLQGKERVSLSKVLITAVGMLHGETQFDSSSFVGYHGEEVHSEKTFALVTSSYLGLAGLMAGLVYDGGTDKIVFNEQLSGLDPSMRAAPTSARAKALGNSYIAISDDAYGAFFNPAGMAWLSGPGASVNFQSRNSLVQSWTASYVDKMSKNWGWGAAFQYAGSPESYLQEFSFSSLISRKFDTFEKFPPFSLGATVTMASMQTVGGSGSEYDIEGSGIGFALDIGGLLYLKEHINVAFTFYNIPAFMWYSNSTMNYHYQENKPARLKIGGSFQVHYATLLIAEGQLPLGRDQVWRFSGGVEQQLWSYIRLRLGAEKGVFASYETPWIITAGFGVEFPVKTYTVSLDGAYQLNLDFELRNTWDVSLMLEF